MKKDLQKPTPTTPFSLQTLNCKHFNRPITEQAYQRTWERINRTINLHGATAHVFRHTFATIAAPYLDIKTLQTIMGHADIETTLDRYTHVQEERI